jgi:hypothetical protein
MMRHLQHQLEVNPNDALIFKLVGNSKNHCVLKMTMAATVSTIPSCGV